MMREYARGQTALLVSRLSQAIERAAQEADADSIHDVRVVLRRLSGCLKVFAEFYPDGSWKRIRRRIAGLMALAGAVRDCDIALQLAGHAGLDGRSIVVRQLSAERHRRGNQLLHSIRRWEKRDLIRRWRKQLELP